MHVVAITYQPEFTVIRDPSCRRLSPPPPVCCEALLSAILTTAWLLVSQTGDILSPHRARLSDSLLSRVIFLKCNKSLLRNIH